MCMDSKAWFTIYAGASITSRALAAKPGVPVHNLALLASVCVVEGVSEGGSL